MTHQGAVPKVEFRELTEKACGARFNCGASEINKYLKNDAWKFHKNLTHRVTYAHFQDAPVPTGFMALATVTEEIRKLSGSYHVFGGADRFPCLQLVWLGVDKQHQGRGVGKQLVARAIGTFIEVGQKIGLPHLILVPISDEVKPFYNSLGFEDYDGGGRMFLPLQTAIDALAAADAP